MSWRRKLNSTTCCWSKFPTFAAASSETSRRVAVPVVALCTQAGERLPQGCLPRRDLRAALLISAIRNSSSLCPDCSAATIHRGCLPRPDHVSVGEDGLKYFGKTFAYLRRGLSASDVADEFGLICSVGFNCARRFSSSSFSAVIFSERIFVSSSCKSHSSSKFIACRSSLPITLSSPLDGSAIQSAKLQPWQSVVSPGRMNRNFNKFKTLDYTLHLNKFIFDYLVECANLWGLGQGVGD